MKDPTDDKDASNKKYVDDKILNADLTPYLKRDGSVSMTGNLIWVGPSNHWYPGVIQLIMLP